MTKKLRNQDIYTKTLKSVVGKKNTILVLPSAYVKLLQQAVRVERDGYIDTLKNEPGIPIAVKNGYEKQLERLIELDIFITNAIKEAKNPTEIDHLITKISVWPEEDRLTK